MDKRRAASFVCPTWGTSQRIPQVWIGPTLTERCGHLAPHLLHRLRATMTLYRCVAPMGSAMMS
jgi:hypothetical protein